MTRRAWSCPGAFGGSLRRILLATDDEVHRSALVDQLAARGLTTRSCGSWGELLAQIGDPRTLAALVDASLPGADGPILQAVATALPHRPQVVTLRGALPPLDGVDDEALDRLLASVATPVLEPEDLELLELYGLGDRPLARLQALAGGAVPVRIEGERGLGKEWLARVLHRLRDPERPFVVAKASDEPRIRAGEPGTLFLEHLEQHPRARVLAALQLAEASGWKVVAGSRAPHDPEHDGRTWTELRVPPLRARPRDLRPLVEHYVRVWRRRLKLPRRRIARALWERLERHGWPGNHREVEAFVVQAVTSTKGPTLAPESLPRRVLALLDPEAYDPRETASFEHTVEERLRPVVARFTPTADGPTLHRLVLDATERALFRLVLARTGGNQKAGAELLGIARNTLRTRLERLGGDG